MAIQFIEMRIGCNGGMGRGLSHQVLPISFGHARIVHGSREQVAKILQCRGRRPMQSASKGLEFVLDKIVGQGSRVAEDGIADAQRGNGSLAILGEAALPIRGDKSFEGSPVRRHAGAGRR